MIHFAHENAVRQAHGWPLLVAVDVNTCNHCPGIVWVRADRAYMCLGCGCLRDARGRESLCRMRRPA